MTTANPFVRGVTHPLFQAILAVIALYVGFLVSVRLSGGFGYLLGLPLGAVAMLRLVDYWNYYASPAHGEN